MASSSSLRKPVFVVQRHGMWAAHRMQPLGGPGTQGLAGMGQGGGAGEPECLGTARKVGASTTWGPSPWRSEVKRAPCIKLTVGSCLTLSWGSVCIKGVEWQGMDFGTRKNWVHIWCFHVLAVPLDEWHPKSLFLVGIAGVIIISNLRDGVESCTMEGKGWVQHMSVSACGTAKVTGHTENLSARRLTLNHWARGRPALILLGPSNSYYVLGGQSVCTETAACNVCGSVFTSPVTSRKLAPRLPSSAIYSCWIQSWGRSQSPRNYFRFLERKDSCRILM